MHNLKMLPKRKVSKVKTARADTSYSGSHKSKRKKKKKTMFSRVLDEAWDVIEDIFD
nr:hypothetical protein [Ruegeria haliotis]